MNIKIGICDDNSDDLITIEEKLKSILESVGYGYDISTFTGGEDLETRLEEAISLDVLLLDIQMPGDNGIKIADKLIQETSLLNIIFVTNMDSMVFEAIHCRPFRFIRKDFLDKELEESILAVMEKISNETLLYNFGSFQDKIKIPIRDVVYIESKAHYLHIHLRGDMHIVRGKISDYQEKLKNHGFLRVHHGFLVNMREVYSITSKNITLDDGEMLPISRKNIEHIKKVYSDFSRRNIRSVDYR